MVVGSSRKHLYLREWCKKNLHTRCYGNCFSTFEKRRGKKPCANAEFEILYSVGWWGLGGEQSNGACVLFEYLWPRIEKVQGCSRLSLCGRTAASDSQRKRPGIITARPGNIQGGTSHPGPTPSALKGGSEMDQKAIEGEIIVISLCSTSVHAKVKLE